MLNNNDLNNFVNSNSVNHDESTRLDEYTKEVLLSENILMNDKRQFGYLVMAYVRYEMTPNMHSLKSGKLKVLILL